MPLLLFFLFRLQDVPLAVDVLRCLKFGRRFLFVARAILMVLIPCWLECLFDSLFVLQLRFR